MIVQSINKNTEKVVKLRLIIIAEIKLLMEYCYLSLTESERAIFSLWINFEHVRFEHVRFEHVNSKSTYREQLFFWRIRCKKFIDNNSEAWWDEMLGSNTKIRHTECCSFFTSTNLYNNLLSQFNKYLHPMLFTGLR